MCCSEEQCAVMRKCDSATFLTGSQLAWWIISELGSAMNQATALVYASYSWIND